MRLGVIESRHTMPVDAYILPSDITDICGFHQALYNIAFNSVIEQVSYIDGVIDLYITGLTVAVLGAIAGLQRLERPYVIFSYDKETDTYKEIFPIT